MADDEGAVAREDALLLPVVEVLPVLDVADEVQQHDGAFFVGNDEFQISANHGAVEAVPVSPDLPEVRALGRETAEDVAVELRALVLIGQLAEGLDAAHIGNTDGFGVGSHGESLEA